VASDKPAQKHKAVKKKNSSGSLASATMEK
jgi:hypothetical protein